MNGRKLAATVLLSLLVGGAIGGGVWAASLSPAPPPKGTVGAPPDSGATTGIGPSTTWSVSPPTFLPTTAESGVMESIHVAVTGASSYFVYDWTGLPTPCETSNSSSLSCTPTEVGTSTVTVTVQNETGATVSNQASLTVANPLSAGSLDISPGTVNPGQSTSITVSPSGGVPPYSYSWSGLPTSCPGGSTLSTIACTTSQSGSYSIGVEVSDQDQAKSPASGQLSVNSGSGCTGNNCNGNGNGKGNGSGNGNGNGSNGLNLSGLFSFSGPLALIFLFGLILFVLILLIAITSTITAVVVLRRLPPRTKAGTAAPTIRCASCQSDVPAGSKFCPNCGKPPAEPKS